MTTDLTTLSEDTDRWHAERLDRLRADDGWLTLVGLGWLEEGDNRVGPGPDDAALYEGLPADLGVIRLDGDAITYRAAPGAPAVTGVPGGGRLCSDADGEPTVLALGSITMYVIKRGDRYAVRIKDSAAPTRRAFVGIDRFPVDPAWRIEARYRAAADGATMPVALITGAVDDETIAGRAAFTVDGHACDVVLMPGSAPDRFFVVFGDATNGDETYGGGRFLEAQLLDDGATVVLDFNRAYNPPCAFTPYATCPLPVEANRLPIAVRAGEKRWGEH